MPRTVIPEGIPLAPADCAGPAAPPAFPLASPRTRYYFLCRNGIHHGLAPLGLGPGDEVLLPSYCHGVELETLCHAGLVPRFYAVPRDLVLDPDALAARITPATRALYVIHYLGWPQPIRALRALADRHGLLLLEDCALALFSAGPGGALGTLGDAAYFCLYKTLPVPQGGALVLNRPDAVLPPPADPPPGSSTLSYAVNGLLDGWRVRGGAFGTGGAALVRGLARRLKRARGLEVEPIDTASLEPDKLDLGISGFARRVLARVRAAELVRRRRRHHALLQGLLSSAVRRALPPPPPGTCPLSFPILVRDKPSVHARLAAEGLHTIDMWRPHPPQLPPGRFPDTDFLRRHLLEVPIHQGLAPHHLRFVARLVERHARW